MQTTRWNLYTSLAIVLGSIPSKLEFTMGTGEFLERAILPKCSSNSDEIEKSRYHCSHRKKRHCKEESNGTGDLWGRKVLSQMILEKKKLTNPRFQQYSAIQRYEELCATISAENFDRLDFPDKSVTGI